MNLTKTITQQEIKKAAIAKYNSYDSSKWEKAYFDRYSGGYNVYHLEHSFSQKGGGGEAEKIVGKMLAKYNGKHVEFLPENSYKKSPDIRFDDKTWDIKYIDKANENTIREYIKDARKADNAIFYFTEDKLKDLTNAINREVGRFKKNNLIETLPDIYYINKDGVLEPIWRK
jgi:hypothetical protein